MGDKVEDAASCSPPDLAGARVTVMAPGAWRPVTRTLPPDQHVPDKVAAGCHRTLESVANRGQARSYAPQLLEHLEIGRGVV